MRECPDCDGPMTRGFLRDRAPASFEPPQAWWVEGEPERSLWSGTKLRDRDVYLTESWRCDACGLVRTYAHERR